MIQFETVKYGILKKTKDNQKMSKGDSTSSCSEEDVLLPETNTLTDEPCANMSSTELIESETTCTATAAIDERKQLDKDSASDGEMDTETHHSSDENLENNTTNGLASSNDDDDVTKMSKHNEDAANNNSNEQDADDDDGTEKSDTKNEQSLDNGFGAAAGGGYFSMEAIQKMAQLVSAAMTNNSDNEDAQKQLTLLQSTLFTLQHQQLFQMQLIQQLQSQLSLSQSGKPDGDDDDDEIDQMEHGDDEREEGELSEEQMAEEQRKYEEEQKAIEIEKEKLRLKQQQLQKQEKDKTNENDRCGKEYDPSKPLDPNDSKGNDALSAMEASFSSPFSSNIITNHDEPSSMDGLNSLEMLQKRAEEVLDSASKGILSGGLTDEMAFKNDGKGRNEPFFKHRCRYCGKVFGSDSALQIHIRSHTGERPFRCNVCGSRFTTKGNLKVHFQRHTQKFPHIPMNPNPIPEHLDKFYPPLLPPIPPGQQAPLSPPASSNNTNVPASPLNLPNLPFPPIPGLPNNLQGLQSLQSLHSLPFLRPPFDLLKQMGAHPFFGAVRDAVQQQQQKERELEQDVPADLSKATDLSKSQIKEEPKDDERDDGEHSHTGDVIEKPKRGRDSKSPVDRKQNESIEKRRSLSPLPHRRSSWKDDNKSDGMSPTPSMENYSPKADQPENLSSRISSKHHSPSSVGSAARDNHFHESQNDLKMFPTLLPRPGSNDNSWESFIEVDRSSETSKLQQFVDNIESKITEPNECGVCHKVLSCHSALIMHYRTHTGIRPFKCLICGRKFTTKGNLKTHMSVHRMKPPTRTVHQCPVCHKKYSNSLVLQQHIRLHTGEPTDLTLEQISAAEITQISPSSGAAAFPMGLNPFAFPIPGLHPGMSAESSNGDNDEMMMDEDFDEESNYEEVSNTGSISGDSNQNISSRLNSSEELRELRELRESRTLRSDHNKSIENLSRAPSATSHADSVDEKRSSSPRTPQPLSPAPSDMSQCALDLTPRSEPKSQNGQNPLPTSAAAAAAAAVAGLNAFPNFPFMHHNHINTTTSMMSGALNSLAQSVAPIGPFNPMALSGVRGNTTCKICFKTFACQSALEIHYRSHTKERPFKCSICDKAFTTKGNMKQHMMTHKLRDVPQHMFSNSKLEQSRNNISPDSVKNTPSLRVRSESELNPRASAAAADQRERSFQSQVDSNYQMMLERQHHLEQIQRQHQLQSRHSPLHLQRQSLSAMSPPQHIKNELTSRQKSTADDADQPAAKRQLLSDSQDIPTSLKEAYQMPPMHESEKTAASHLERLQQFHTSSLLNQPIKLDPSSHMKSSATSPSSNDADQKHFCHLCQKNFSSTSSLQIHMRTHTGERPFVCSVCQKAFTTKGNLKVHMGIHTWSGASRRGRRMSLELPFNGTMPLMLQNPEFLQRHSDFFHPYPPHLISRMTLEHQKLDREAMNLASKYMNANGLSRGHRDERQYSNPPSPADSDKQQISPNSLRDERYTDSPKRNGDRDHSPSPRMWKLHYESKAVNRDSKSKGDDQNKPVEELTA